MVEVGRDMSGHQDEQFFIHEGMLNSLVGQLMQNTFPLTVNDSGISDEVMMAFPEIRHKFGTNTTA